MSRLSEEYSTTGLEIGVIGISLRFPGARTIDEFWHNLINSVESIRFFSEQELEKAGAAPQLLKDPDFVKARGLIEDTRYFDADFFRYTPKEARFIDPQVRIFHQCTWAALENAGYDPAAFPKLIGIYAGASPNFYWETMAMSEGEGSFSDQFETFQFAHKDYLCTHISYKLGLRGPAVNVQTACSTSLAAIHAACQGLISGECDMALAGGVTVNPFQVRGYMYQEGMVVSGDGHCRAFDARSTGTIFGYGAGVVVLKRLEDAVSDGDNIYALVKGTAINNDGDRKSGYTAPSIEGQSEAIRAALQVAEVEPESIGYIETHGTGTQLGDPIEIEALKTAFNTSKKGFCRIGSVKTNIGHLDNAAGVAGFIKTVLILKHKEIPPSLHFETPNPAIDFDNSPFAVNRERYPWKRGAWPRRAGVSSLGIGGTNAHAILEETPVGIDNEGTRGLAPLLNQETPNKYQLILLSANTPTALDQVSRNLLDYFKQSPPIHFPDAVYTLQVGRRALPHRRMFLCTNLDEAVKTLSSPDFSSIPYAQVKAKKGERPVIFMFSGLGTQYINMGADLYREEPLFRQEVDRCFNFLASQTGVDLKRILYPGEEAAETENKIHQLAYSSPIKFTFDYSLARLLMQWGIQPYAMIGHSFGEYVAACLAGVFSLEDALMLADSRGKLLQRMAPGAMLGVPLPEEEVRSLLDENLWLAAVNTASNCIVSGSLPAIEGLETQLEKKGIECIRLRVPRAGHSKIMETITGDFEKKLQQLTFKHPQLPYISGVTAQWITDEEATDPGYWAGHLRKTIRFFDGVSELLREPGCIFLEVGPGRGLSSFVEQHPGKTPGHLAMNLIKHPKETISDLYYLLDKVGQLWLNGVTVDWKGFHRQEERRRIPLPTYPFEGQPYWLREDRLNAVTGQERTILAARRKEDISQWFYVPSWIRSRHFSHEITKETRASNWLVFLDDHGLGEELLKQLSPYSKNIAAVRVGQDFSRVNHREFTIHPGKKEHYEELFKELEVSGQLPDKILHLWNIVTMIGKGSQWGWLDQLLDLGFYSLLYLAQALGGRAIDKDKEILVVSTGLQEVTGGETLQPGKAALLGPVKVIPREYPHMASRSLDIETPPKGSGEEAALIRRLLSEFEIKSSAPVVAYRGNHRWEQILQPVQPEVSRSSPGRLRDKGVYLVTGGLGGIGLILAEYLAKKVQARLILTGRSDFPPRQEWDQWCARHDENDPVSQKIRKIQALEEMGARVSVFCADVAHQEQMKSVIARGKETFGQIHGVIHCAGVLGEGLIRLYTREMAREVLAPKVKGTLLLDLLLKDEQLDFFVLCSSLSSILGTVGQVSYCGANAFLDAFVYQKSIEGTFTVAINWCPWREVGMAAAYAAKHLESKPGTGLHPGGMNYFHPLLEQCLVREPDRAIYVTRFSPGRHWVLEEHRTGRHGVLPGTAYLEMVRAAWQDFHGNGSGTASVEIRDVYFNKPLMVEDNEEKEVRVILEKQNKEETLEFVVISRFKPNEEKWQKHAVGKITRLKQTRERKHEIQTIASQCTEKETFPVPADPQSRDGFFRFGPRWSSVKNIKYGKIGGLAVLELPGKYAGDCEMYRLHPALLDCATGFFYKHIDNKNFYIPYAYKDLKLKGPLQGKLFSHSRLVPVGGDPGPREEILTFNITIINEQGTELVDIEGFTMVAASGDIRERIDKGQEEFFTKEMESGTPGKKSEIDEFFKSGIRPGEGVEVFVRIMEDSLPQVLVSPMELNVEASPGEQQGDRDHREQKFEPGIESGLEPGRSQYPGREYAPPGNEIQRSLANMFQEFFSIPRVGVHDNFFELGGDSLKALTISAKIHKQFNVKVPLKEFFRSPTIHGLSTHITTASMNTYSSIAIAEKKDYYILSSAQKRMYLIYQMDVESVSYNLPKVVTLEGDLSLSRLKSAVKKLIQRHDSLRTSFGMVNEEPVQIIHDHPDFGIECYDMKDVEVKVEEEHSPVSRESLEGTRGLAPLAVEPSVRSPQPTAALINSFIRPFDLSRAPLMRVGVTRQEEKKHILMIDIHHNVCDGTSLIIFFQELMALHEGEKLRELKIQYKDFSEWQNKEIEKKEVKVQEKFWLNEFSGEIPVLNLPTDYIRPVVQRYEGNTLRFKIGKEKTAALKVLALKSETSLFMVLLAIFNILLMEISGQEDMVIGTPAAGRRHTDLESIIGMFLNTLALRNYPTKEKKFNAFLTEVKERTLKAFENQDYPFEELVEKVRVVRDTSRSPLFDVMLVFHNEVLLEKIPGVEITGLKLLPYEFKHKMTIFDLTLRGEEIEDSLFFRLEYCTKLFKEKTAWRFVNYFKKILSLIINNTERKISGIEIISKEEKKQVLYDFNNTTAQYPANKAIHQLFAEQVERTPDYTALIGKNPKSHRDQIRNPKSRAPFGQINACGDRVALPTENVSITYRELNEKSNQLARTLIERGALKDSIVGIMAERSVDMVIGILGILKTGGAYLTIDPDYPEERIQYMLNDSGSRLLLVDDFSSSSISSWLTESNFNCQLSIINCQLSINFTSDFYLHLSPAPVTSLAYIIYTSGSTGRPKGVMVEQASLVNILAAMQKKYPLKESDAYLLKTSYVFDVSVAELFGWFFEGGKLVILGNDEEKDPGKILDTIERCRITHINFVPSMFNAFVEALDSHNISQLSGLRYIFLAGEALLPGPVAKFRRLHTNIALENIYGPTEGTVYASKYSLSQWDGIGTIPIGKPMQNIRLYIMDKDNHLQPIGVPGELCIEGVGVARGYLNRPGLTAEKFDHDFWDFQDKRDKQGTDDKINKKFLRGGPGGVVLSKRIPPGRRSLYKTGDLTRWLPDGNIEFLGRIDHQVKIRGFRIEPGEIESQLLIHSHIKDAIVIAAKDDKGDQYLCAYVVSNNKISVPGLKEYLSRGLPGYMIPSYFVRLDQVPLTGSGKVDRKSLPKPFVGETDNYTPPRDHVENRLKDIWLQVLGSGALHVSIGIDDNFFRLGGHSLKATLLLTRIYKEFGVKLPLADVFKLPTIRRLSRCIKSKEKTKYVKIEAVEEKEYYPMSSAQKRMFILNRIKNDDISDNITRVMQVRGKLDLQLFEETLQTLVKRHEAFRTSFCILDSSYVQRIPREVDLKIVYLEANEKEIDDIIHKFVVPFDLEKAPLLRVGLIGLSHQEHVLMFDVHHIISDAVSLGILTNEFEKLYYGVNLPILKIQYKDFVSWQNRRLHPEIIHKQKEYWLSIFPGEIPILLMPTDYPRPPVQSFEGDYIEFTLSRALVSRISNLVLNKLASLYMVLLAIYNILLSRYCGREDIIVGTPIAGRLHPDLDHIIGFFVNTLAVRNFPEGEKRFFEFLEEVKHNALNAFENQDYPFDDLISTLNLQRDPGRSILFDTMFAVQNAEYIPGKNQQILTREEMNLMFKPYKYKENITQFDIIIHAFEGPTSIDFKVRYCTKLFTKETIELFMRHFEEIAQAVTENEKVRLKDLSISHRLLSTKTNILEKNTGDFDF